MNPTTPSPATVHDAADEARDNPGTNPDATPSPAEPRKPVTLSTLRKMKKAGEVFSVLTCYDATTARWLEQARIDVLLVGDTAAEMILGFDQTIYAPLDFMLWITAAVKRGAPSCFIMGDMPFMSYQASEERALVNAGRFLTEGNADAVKLEVDETFAPLVARMTRAGIPVVAHIGSRPQSVRQTGGYRSAGKTAAEGRRIIDQARKLEDHGAVLLLLEATTQEVTQRVIESVDVPVIGCGAGPGCAGHVVVLHDLLGLTRWQPPFAPPAAHVGPIIADAARKWIQTLRSGEYLKRHVYHMQPEQIAQLDPKSP